MIDVNAINAIIRRFEKKDNVRGVIMCASDGFPIKSNLPTDEAENISSHISLIVGKSRSTLKKLKEGD